MPRPASPRTSATVRVFTDTGGRLWSAAASGEVLVFNCVTETRRAARAIAIRLAELDESVSDDTLRAWLDEAPLIGQLL